MRLKRQSNNQFIVLEPSAMLGVGGEAGIYEVPQDPSLAAKVYHQPTDQRARKLAVMLANPPDDPMAAQGHASIAWPGDLLHSTDGKNQVVGFLMPRMTGMKSILSFYNPKTRRQNCPLFNYLYLHRTARNLAAAMRALHERGYVIGDVNESNIFVADTTLVTLVDTDSFQVFDPHDGITYRCMVGKPEFTPPELQGKTFANIDRSPEHDLFGLAVTIFQLLMEGTHPFAGIFQGKGDPPTYKERISAGHFPYGRGWRVPYRSALTATPFKILNPVLRDLFVRCFKAGRRRPKARPDAQTWQNALNAAEDSLITCSDNDQHRYGDHLKTCPWCERSVLLGSRDPFPSRQSVEKGQHLQPILPVQEPLSPAGKTVTSSPMPAKTPTATKQSLPTTYSFWAWTALVLALLCAFILADSRRPIPWWLSLVCGATVAGWAVDGWRRARALAGYTRWLAVVALGMGAAAGIALLLIALLSGGYLNWWTMLLLEAILGSAASVSGVISWRRAKALAKYSRSIAAAALGAGMIAMVLVLLSTALLISEKSLPWWLSLIFMLMLIPAALICGIAGFRWVKALAGQNRWLAAISLGMGTAVMIVILLGISEAFMVASGRLHLTTVVCALILVPLASICGILGWQRVRILARQDSIWSLGLSCLLFTMFMIACGQIYVAALIYAVMLGATVFACVYDWPRVKALAGHGRWLVGVALGTGISLTLALLFSVAPLISRRFY